MNILLLKPIHDVYYVISPNLGLGYLAAIAKEKDHSVRIFDSGKERATWGSFAELIRAHRFDIVGIQVFTHELSAVRRHTEIIRDVSPETAIIVGGPHPSSLPEQTIEFLPEADFAFAGEAEKGWSAFLELGEENYRDAEKLKTISGLVWRSVLDGSVTVNPVERVERLDDIDFPLWEAMRPDRYPPLPHGTFSRRFPVAPLIVSRGCPFQCTYCGGHAVTGRAIRYRSVENVVREMLFLRDTYTVREFHIEDDNFTFDREYVRQLCERLIGLGSPFFISCPNGVRLERFDEELIKLMERAGFYSFAVGIEFGTDKILQATKKGLTTALIKEKVALIKRTSRIRLTGFFLLGHPDEKEEDMRETIRFSKTLPIDKASFMYLMPLPGTPLWDDYLTRVDIRSVDWDRFFYYRTFNLSAVSDGTVSRLQRRAMLSFYLRPRIIWSALSEIRSLSQVTILLRRVLNIVLPYTRTLKKKRSGRRGILVGRR